MEAPEEVADLRLRHPTAQSLAVSRSPGERTLLLILGRRDGEGARSWLRPGRPERDEASAALVPEHQGHAAQAVEQGDASDIV